MPGGIGKIPASGSYVPPLLLLLAVESTSPASVAPPLPEPELLLLPLPDPELLLLPLPEPELVLLPLPEPELLLLPLPEPELLLVALPELELLLPLPEPEPPLPGPPPDEELPELPEGEELEQEARPTSTNVERARQPDFVTRCMVSASRGDCRSGRLATWPSKCCAFGSRSTAPEQGLPKRSTFDDRLAATVALNAHASGPCSNPPLRPLRGRSAGADCAQ
jgi:hypothetical protein